MNNSKLSKEYLEVINDAFWLSYLLHIKRKIKDTEIKSYLANFLVFFCSIFVEEIKISGLGDINKVPKKTLDIISKLRNYNLKYLPVMKSSEIKKKVKEMGITPDNYTFDINVIIDNNELFDINFRNWEYNNIDQEYLNIINDIVITPEVWVEKLLLGNYENIIKELESITQKFIEQINNQKFKRKSYSTYKLFLKSNYLSTDDKIYIQQRYGLVKTIVWLNNIFKDNISVKFGPIELNMNVFLKKIISTLFEMLWNDYKNNNLNVLQEIFNINKENIDPVFYTINRKLRDNFHYKEIYSLNDKEWNIIEKYQNVYLNNILSVFDSKINLNFGIMYNIGLSFAKLEYWSRNEK